MTPVNLADPSGKFGIGAIVGIGIGTVQGALGAMAQGGSVTDIVTVPY